MERNWGKEIMHGRVSANSACGGRGGPARDAGHARCSCVRACVRRQVGREARAGYTRVPFPRARRAHSNPHPSRPHLPNTRRRQSHHRDNHSLGRSGPGCAVLLCRDGVQQHRHVRVAQERGAIKACERARGYGRVGSGGGGVWEEACVGIVWGRSRLHNPSCLPAPRRIPHAPFPNDSVFTSSSTYSPAMPRACLRGRAGGARLRLGYNESLCVFYTRTRIRFGVCKCLARCFTLWTPLPNPPFPLPGPPGPATPSPPRLGHGWHT